MKWLPDNMVEIDHDGPVIGSNGKPVETELSKLIDFGDKHVWIPENPDIEMFEDSVIIPEWLAKEKKLI